MSLPSIGACLGKTFAIDFLYARNTYVGIIACLAAVGYYLYRKRQLGDRPTHKRRRVSVSTRSMLEGFYPKSVDPTDIVVNSMLFFDDELEVEDLAAIRNVCFEYPRLRAVPRLGADGEVEWEELSKEREDEMLSKRSFDSFQEVMAFVENIFYEPMDPLNSDRVPWEAMVLSYPKEEEEGEGRESVVLFRVHHGVADGISLAGLGVRIFTTEEGVPFEIPPAKTSGSSKGNYSLPNILKAAATTIYNGLGPYDTVTSFSHFPKDPQTGKRDIRFKHGRKVVFFPTVSLQHMKNLKNAMGCTINDVILGIASGMIERYCKHRGDVFTGDEMLRGTIPLGFPRSVEEMTNPETALRNKFAVISAPFALNKASSRERVMFVKEYMDDLKKSAIPGVAFWILELILGVSTAFGKQTAFDMSSRHSIVFSNVPGPQEQLYLGTHRLKGVQALFPNLTPQTIMVSYNGQVSGNIIVDPEVVKEPELFAQFFMDELVQLTREVGLDEEDILPH